MQRHERKSSILVKHNNSLKMDWDISLEDINEILSQRCNIDELYQDLMDSLQYKTDHDVIDMSGQESTKSPASSESSWSSDDSAPPSVKKRQQNRKSPNVAHWLYGLLNDSKHSHILTWTNGRKNGEFEILKQEALAKLWGHRGSKSNDRMTYGNLA